MGNWRTDPSPGFVLTEGTYPVARVTWPTVPALHGKTWNEEDHPRVPAGSGDESGQFTSGGGGGLAGSLSSWSVNDTDLNLRRYQNPEFKKPAGKTKTGWYTVKESEAADMVKAGQVPKGALLTLRGQGYNEKGWVDLEVVVGLDDLKPNVEWDETRRAVPLSQVKSIRVSKAALEDVLSEDGDAPGGGEINVSAARRAGLSDREIEHISQWIGEGANYEAMRSPSTPEGKAFKTLLNKLPAHSGTVYRGMVLSQAQIDKLAETKVISIAKFSSSSQVFDVAHDFMTNEQEERENAGRREGQMVLMELKTTTGRSLHSVLMPGMPYTEEQEIILMPKTKYAITSVRRSGAGYTIKATQA